MHASCGRAGCLCSRPRGRPVGGEDFRIGLLTWASCEGAIPGSDEFDPLVRGLIDLGYKPGETITIECRSAGQHHDHLAAAAAELVKDSGGRDRQQFGASGARRPQGH